ncbi:MAG: hypothetical protein RLZZ553_1334, partial [Verrucomicrobiota bacterium]
MVDSTPSFGSLLATAVFLLDFLRFFLAIGLLSQMMHFFLGMPIGRGVINDGQGIIS